MHTWLGGGAVVLGQVVVPVDRPPAARENRACKIRLRTTHHTPYCIHLPNSHGTLPRHSILGLGRCQWLSIDTRSII